LFWIEQGVTIFRVDNPHTKPLIFWDWLIREVHGRHPGIVFLAEAFTRPKIMKALAKVGFTQSYTYFTWRNTKWELVEYLTELAHTEMAEYYRPNFWPNTPDILPEVLQVGGHNAFQIRFLLAATLSPNYGIYSGFELCENEAIPGHEEYLNSEKYEIRVRDWDAPGNIKPLITRVNALRREHPALQDLRNIRFLDCDNDQILAYAKQGAPGVATLLIAVNLNPEHPQATTVVVPPDVVGVEPGETYRVHDLLTGDAYEWSENNYVRLVPGSQPAHIFRVERHSA
jgi:starch synthase (maltosyl-transferring)